MDRVVRFLKKRSFQIAVIISLVAHVCLILFAAIRRRRSSRSLRRGLPWVSYLLADWAPGYVLSNLYLEDRSTQNLIVAFWVPFLLLNIRPDNISAYASEDNKLSIRPIVSFVLQFFGIIYVLVRHDITGTAGTLRYASIIMYAYGIAKYSENLLALWRGDLKRIQKRFEKERKKKRCCPPQYTQGSLDYQKARLVAHDLLHLLFIPVGGINAGPEVHPSISSLGLKDKRKVVEMEVQLLYELIYTKTAVVYTWHGYLLRLASPVLTTAALVLFSFQCRDQEQHDPSHPSNVTVTFTLLITTLVLDLMWLVITLGSTWTYAYLKDRPGHLLHGQVHCGGGWHQLRDILVSLDPCRLFVMEPRKYCSWPDNIEQLSVLNKAQQEIDKRMCCMAIPSARQNRHPQSQNLMEEAKDLLFSRIWESSKSASSTGPEDTPAKKAGLLRRRRRPLRDALPFGPEIQEVMISWHMATEMFFSFSIESYQSSKSVYVKAIMSLSNHLMFLAAERPEMLPGLNVHSLFQSTKLILKEIIRSNKQNASAASREKDLADILRNIGGKRQPPAGIRPVTIANPDPMTGPCNYWTYQCRCIQENICNWGCQCHCHAVQENPCSWSHQCRCSGSCQCDGTDDPIASDQKKTGSGKEKEKNTGSSDEEKPHMDDSQDHQGLNSIILDGISFSEVLINVASGEEDLSACLNRMEEKTKDTFLKLMPEFRDPLDKLDIPVILDLMFDTWVRMLIHMALLSSRDSHEKQLSRGSEFLTTIWILTSHAGIEDHID